MPVPTVPHTKEQLDAYFETFHEVSSPARGQYSFDNTKIVLPYIPYFSNCYGYDSYIPFWMFTEDHVECQLPKQLDKKDYRRKQPPLPSQDNIKSIGSFDVLARPMADVCKRKLKCNYEEPLDTQESTPRWYEGDGETLFKIIREPLNYEKYTGRGRGEGAAPKNPGEFDLSKNDGGGGLFVDELTAITTDYFIPVTVSSGSGPGTVPRKVNFAVGYFQIDDYNKRIVYSNVRLENIDSDLENKEYDLQINFFALGYLTLILNFAFPLDLFNMLFLVVGLFTVICAILLWITMRLTTQLQTPPELKIGAMLWLIAPPPLAGVGMALIPVFIYVAIGNYFINGAFMIDPRTPGQYFAGLGDRWSFSMEYVDLSFNTWSPDTQSETSETGFFEEARNGRIGLVFMFVSLSLLIVAAELFYPKAETKKDREIARMRTDLAAKEDIWNPVMWKKQNLILASLVMALQSQIMLQFSYSEVFGNMIFQMIFMLMAFGIFNDTALEYQVKESLPALSLGAGNALFQQIVTYGSPNFLAFLCGNFLGVFIQMFERIYLDAFMDISYVSMEDGLEFIIRTVKRFTPSYLRKKEDNKKTKKQAYEVKKREIDDVEETSGDSVEPIVNSYSGAAVDTCLLYLFPYIIFLWMQYRTQIGIPVTYGIRQSDMEIYMLFQLWLIPFQSVFDILVHASNELFWGWKVYEYLVYSKYRYLQREQRWKGLESNLDECIEEPLRTLDQMCFSSQFYFMYAIHVLGIMFMVFGLEAMMNSRYNMFADVALVYLTIYMAITHYIVEKSCIYLADKLQIWRIKHENTDWHLKLAEEDELDIPGWEDVKGASHEAYLMNQRITSDTFRYKFLNYNRSWIIHQLPQLLTPRTKRRSRPYLINQLARIINARRDDISDDSEGEGKDQRGFGPVALNNSSRSIIRWWLGQARRRLRLKSIVDPLVRKARGVECEQCLSRKQLQVEYDIDVDEMSMKYLEMFPEDEEIDQVQWKAFWNKNQKYHTICLACLSKRKEKVIKEALAGAGGFAAILYDDEQEGYPDFGPVYLSAASKAILMSWYRKAQMVRQAKKGVNRRAPKVIKAISDDEGDDEVPLEWAKQMEKMSASSKAIALKWVRTARAGMQKRAGKGASLSEKQLVLTSGDKAAVAKEGTFQSGRKSLTMRK